MNQWTNLVIISESAVLGVWRLGSPSKTSIIHRLVFSGLIDLIVKYKIWYSENTINHD